MSDLLDKAKIEATKTETVWSIVKQHIETICHLRHEKKFRWKEVQAWLEAQGIPECPPDSFRALHHRFCLKKIKAL